MNSDRNTWILLNRIPELTSLKLHRLLAAFGDAAALTQASPQTLQQMGGLTQILAQKVVAIFKDQRALDEECEKASKAGVKILTWDDEAYPERLRQIPDPPLVLYVAGTLDGHEQAVAIVGSRHASLYGQQTAERLSYDLALRGVTVVSGLARGVDAAAHRGALKASGKTLAVLGSGLGRLYPPEHEALARQIQNRGAVISEYPMDSPPLPTHFPRRNRLISGFSLGVVVVEAAQRSGALITADCALDQGREVFAVPGPITAPTSQGTHQLLQQGAKLVTSVEDILEELPLSKSLNIKPTSRSAPMVTLSVREQHLLDCLEKNEPYLIDQIAEDGGCEVAEVAALLLTLELKGRVQQLPGKRFVRISGRIDLPQ